jgi:hydrogenase small subunit
MDLNRRDFLKASSAVAGALGLTASGLIKLQDAWAAEGASPPIVWLQGQNCTGCSVSLLNTIYYATIDNLLTSVVDLQYHTTVMAAAGDLAVSAANDVAALPHILVVEGAIPTGSGGKYAEAWPGTTVLQAVQKFANNAAYIIAVGTCASFGGMPAGGTNPTGAKSVSAVLPGKTVINLPGCPAHPDWIVGTIAYILKNGKAPALDANGRPTTYYGTLVHDQCPRLEHYLQGQFATKLGDTSNCMDHLGCQGWRTKSDCPSRKWNSGAAGQPGVNWCLGAGAPCLGCVEPTFPGPGPFYKLEASQQTSATSSTGGTSGSGSGTGTGTGTGGTTGATGTSSGSTSTGGTTSGGTTSGGDDSGESDNVRSTVTVPRTSGGERDD